MEENLTQLESSDHAKHGMGYLFPTHRYNNSQGTFSLGEGSNDFKLFESKDAQSQFYDPRAMSPKEI
jgi:hypothetical protein